MNLLKHRSMRFYFVFFLILTMAIGGSAIAAFADSGSNTGASVAVGAGQLSETSPGSVQAAPVTLTGDDQTTTYSFGLAVTDARGNAGGWNLTISATQFDDGSGHTLPSDAQYISAAPTAVCASNGGSGHCTAPVNNVSYASALTVTTSAQKFFNAAANSGLGKFTVTPTVNVFIPANTIAATYSSTVSLAVVSGP